jgi:amyloid beta precursor protein binding protein 1
MSLIGTDSSLDDKYLKELLRFSDSRLHTVSAFLGGVASQESIKLLIRQYTPQNHTFIYDGIHSKSQVFNV